MRRKRSNVSPCGARHGPAASPSPSLSSRKRVAPGDRGSIGRRAGRMRGTASGSHRINPCRERAAFRQGVARSTQHLCSEVPRGAERAEHGNRLRPGVARKRTARTGHSRPAAGFHPQPEERDGARRLRTGACGHGPVRRGVRGAGPCPHAGSAGLANIECSGCRAGSAGAQHRSARLLRNRPQDRTQRAVGALQSRPFLRTLEGSRARGNDIAASRGGSTCRAEGEAEPGRRSRVAVEIRRGGEHFEERAVARRGPLERRVLPRIDDASKNARSPWSDRRPLQPAERSSPTSIDWLAGATVTAADSSRGSPPGP